MIKTKPSDNFIKVPEDYFALIEIKGINYGHVCLLSKIESLSSKNGKCTASNGYFASLLHTTERNIQLMLKALKDSDIIKQFEEKQGLKTTTRYIYVQYDKIKSILGHEENDTSSQITHEENCDSTRRKLSEDTKKDVEGHEENCQTTRRDLHPNKRIKEKKKDNKRIKRENEADASNELSVFANARVDADACVSSEPEDEFGFSDAELGIVSSELKEKVIAFMKKGYKYNKNNPQIQKATGLSGKQIHEIISSYMESGSDTGKSKSKDDTEDCIPLASGGLSNFRFSDYAFHPEEDSDIIIKILDEMTDPNGDYKYDYNSVVIYLKRKYPYYDITGKFKPPKIDYEGIAAYKKLHVKPDDHDEIDSLTDEIFDIDGIGVDVDLMNELYANDFENPDVPF